MKDRWDEVDVGIMRQAAGDWGGPGPLSRGPFELQVVQ